ncbi:type I restriction endonuclease subunit R [Sporosarcina koreensis]|uniref:type I restriction endonuclease subunit R n=1 Tax=Sporosarcina koreensis TaxID=334735 RepID=UPI00058AF20C|nr:DEAD/DEAH box helicase family protein [Sporosarcina koreensis]
MLENKEVRFEKDIETSLTNEGGWESVAFKDTNYNPQNGLDTSLLVSFVQETQPKAWKRYVRIYHEDAEEKFIKRFNEEVNAHGMLHVLRKGVRDRGVTLQVIYFRPVSSLSYENIEQFKSNHFQCIRQFAYNNRNTIDMALAVNGIPLVALELKNQYTGQTVEHAKVQFENDRDPNEIVFQFNKRFLVYFAVDHYEVYMTTKLAKHKTYFLPFNQGSNGAGRVGGKGNPHNEESYPTAYLWEQVLNRNQFMDILERFMNFEAKKNILIFPRFHQLDVVNKLVQDVEKHGSGKNYLIQHSAGSGKSNSIAWLAYHLASLHDENNDPIYSSVLIVTDRTVLDRQLQDTITSFEHTTGQVEVIGDNKTSQDLKDAINDKKKIIITTLQKFPVIYDEVDEAAGRRFAILVDEAHSSQTGSSAQKLKQALADKAASLKEYQEIEEGIEDQTLDDQDQLVNTLLSQGQHKNLSFFAFTATPKEKTIEMFGTKQIDGSFAPFHIYSMRQAIEEEFILDVLSNYMTYKTSYKIAREIEDNPELPKTEAVRAIARYQSFHPWVLRQKTEVMIEQFREVTKKAIGGRAKAMIVTPSRLHAVRYMKEFKAYIEEKGYTDLDVLVAFSGSVTDDDNEYTEPGMNITKDGERIKENQLKVAFNSDDFNLLIVAEKYQTGFDEPLLHTMFVDKKLRGVKAVQTLSRLNRTMQGKKDTFILDFVNTEDEILEAFQPFYESTTLQKEVNLNLIYDTQSKLRKFALYNDDDIAQVMKLVKQAQKRQDERLLGRMSSLFMPVIKRYEDLPDDTQYEFRVTLRNFGKWYNYVSQLDRTFDMELLEESIYTGYLLKFIPKEKREKVDIEDKIKLEYYKLQKDFEGEILLVAENEKGGELKHPEEFNANVKPVEERDSLEEIIHRINERFPNDFSPQDRVIVETLHKAFTEVKDAKIVNMAKNNSQEMFENSLFKDVFLDRVMDEYTKNTEAYQRLIGADDSYFKTVYAFIAADVYKTLRSEV